MAEYATRGCTLFERRLRRRNPVLGEASEGGRRGPLRL